MNNILEIETIKITDLNQLKNVLNLFYNKDMTFWQGIDRKYFQYNPNPTRFSYIEQTNMKNNLLGQIGTGTLTLDYRNRTATMVSTSTIDGRKQTLTSVISLDENDSFVLKTNYTFISFMALANMNAIKKTPAYTKAISILGNPNASDLEVAEVFASATWSCNLNIPNILPTDVSINVIKDNTPEGKPILTADFYIKGVKTSPSVIRWWLTPDYKQVSWVPSATGNLLGEYTSGQLSLTIDTDLRNRKDFVIMSPKNVRIQCQVQYKLDDGTLSSVLFDKTMDFPELPIFNYFNL